MTVKEALAILGVKDSASNEDIRLAYRRLAAIWHPDVHAHSVESQTKAEQLFKDINEAFERLKDGEWRKYCGPTQSTSSTTGPSESDFKSNDYSTEPPTKSNSKSEEQKASDESKTKSSSTEPKTPNPKPTKAARIAFWKGPLIRRISRAWDDSTGDYFALWSAMGFDMFSLLFMLPILILMIPSYFLVIPLDSVFFPNAKWSRIRGWVAMICLQAAAVAVIASPLLMTQSLEKRFHTNRLCTICGRPGELVKYVQVGGPATVFKVYCPIHNYLAPKESTVGSSEVETPSGGASSTVTYCVILWLCAVFFSSTICQRDMRKMVVALSPFILIILGILYFSNRDLIFTMLSK